MPDHLHFSKRILERFSQGVRSVHSCNSNYPPSHSLHILPEHYMNAAYPISPPSLEIQLSAIGFSSTIQTIELSTVISNIQKDHGSAFLNTHFMNKNPAECAEVLQALMFHNLLRPKTIGDIFRSEEFLTTIKNMKIKDTSKAWDFAAIGKFHGMHVCETVFKSGIRVNYGVFPADFSHIQPGHNQYPENARHYTDKPMIQIQRLIDVPDAEFFNKLNFDAVYFANQNSRLFSTILKGALNNAQKNDGAEYTRSPSPGCWWIDPVNLLNNAKLPITTALTPDRILQVLFLGIYSRPFLISFRADLLGSLCQDR